MRIGLSEEVFTLLDKLMNNIPCYSESEVTLIKLEPNLRGSISCVLSLRDSMDANSKQQGGPTLPLPAKGISSLRDEETGTLEVLVYVVVKSLFSVSDESRLGRLLIFTPSMKKSVNRHIPT
jgi:hypothetical protein